VTTTRSSRRRTQNSRRKFLISFVAIAVVASLGSFISTQRFGFPFSTQCQLPLAAGSSCGTVTTTSTPGSTSSTTPVIAPLTGLSDPTGLSVHRPALTIKIENTPDARPQYGVDRADVVYEEIVEGGITRLAAVFNQFSPPKVGPVRSVRKTDQAIVWCVGGLFAFSGGAPYAVASIKTAPVEIFSETRAGIAMFRDPKRYAPHNLYANAANLFQFKGTPTPPRSIFTYRASGATTPGAKVKSFKVGFRMGYATSFYWNKDTASWDRVIFAKPDVTGTGVQVSPKNVIVMWITYAGGVGSFGAEGVMVGTGRAEVFTNGRAIVGTWSRASKTDPIVYRDSSGNEISMTPGQTWVELAATSDPVTVTPR